MVGAVQVNEDGMMKEVPEERLMMELARAITGNDLVMMTSYLQMSAQGGEADAGVTNEISDVASCLIRLGEYYEGKVRETTR